MGVKERIAKYGLRVICLACGTPARHFPHSGRLRNQTCRQCGVPGFVVSWAWVCRFTTRAEQKRKKAQEVMAALG
jgi:ribosomal protein S14